MGIFGQLAGLSADYLLKLSFPDILLYVSHAHNTPDKDVLPKILLQSCHVYMPAHLKTKQGANQLLNKRLGNPCIQLYEYKLSDILE